MRGCSNITPMCPPKVGGDTDFTPGFLLRNQAATTFLLRKVLMWGPPQSRVAAPPFPHPRRDWNPLAALSHICFLPYFISAGCLISHPFCIPPQILSPSQISWRQKCWGQGPGHEEGSGSTVRARKEAGAFPRRGVPGVLPAEAVQAAPTVQVS